MRIPGSVLRELLGHAQLSSVDKTVYMTAAATQPRSISELASHAGVSRNAATQSCRKLSKLGWMSLSRAGESTRPLALIPRLHQERMARFLEKIYDWVQDRGEFLMKCWLDLRVNCDEYVDNARPKFLANPMTGEPLEYDRLYGIGIAFEHHGAQHFGPTDEYPDAQAWKQLAARDLMKESLSVRAGIRLVVVPADKLRPGEFEKLLPADLPQNVVDEDGPYYKTLARICRAYSDKAAREGAARQTKPGTAK